MGRKVANRLLAVASALVVMVLSACSGQGSSQTTTGASASCAATGKAHYLAAAQLAFTGVMLQGPTVSAAGRVTLASPARFRVVRYLKGAGPTVVTVKTAFARGSHTVIANSEGITPAAGQHWIIYSVTRGMPFDTSICAGSKPVG